MDITVVEAPKVTTSRLLSAVTLKVVELQSESLYDDAALSLKSRNLQVNGRLELFPNDNGNVRDWALRVGLPAKVSELAKIVTHI